MCGSKVVVYMNWSVVCERGDGFWGQCGADLGFAGMREICGASDVWIVGLTGDSGSPGAGCAYAPRRQRCADWNWFLGLGTGVQGSWLG